MNREPTFQLPGQWSTVAPQIDRSYYFIYWLSVVLFVAITGTLLYFVVKYRRRPGVKAAPTGHNQVLEIAWTVAPLFLLIYLFHDGFRGYIDMWVAPANAIDIRLRASRWQWEFEYPNGNTAVNELRIPRGRPVRLIMTSSDVLHSFFVPVFRTKHDVVPGFYQTMWFEATRTGTTDIFCTEYCGAPETSPPPPPPNWPAGRPFGTGHSGMLARLTVVEPDEFDRFLREGGRRPADLQTDEQWGERLANQSGCTACHSTDGSTRAGPTWRGLSGRTESMTDGTVVHVDDAYIRESILNPQARIVRGFAPVMQPFRLQDRQLNALVSYIRSLH